MLGVIIGFIVLCAIFNVGMFSNDDSRNGFDEIFLLLISFLLFGGDDNDL